MTYWVGAAVAAGLVVAAIGLYNRLVRLRERYRNAFAQIDVQLKRRHDLVPNLVETVKGYMEHERETLEAVIDARTKAASAEKQAALVPGEPAAMLALVNAESLLGGLLTRIFALAEDYPELRASENMRQLQEELTSTENRIAFARQAYNDAVMRFNAARASVPANVVAAAFAFRPAEFFRLHDPAERETPDASFG